MRPVPLLILVLFLTLTHADAQMITGVWKGKINRQKVEVKIIQNADSITGTSYYYESSGNYRRYSIRGYFDPTTNAAVWWDDQLIEEKSGRFNLSLPGRNALLSRADFNCPGDGKMMLDGNAFRKEDDARPQGEVHLDKAATPDFEDEWDFIIENFTTGTNDPEIIDSIAQISTRSVNPEPPREMEEKPRRQDPVTVVRKPETSIQKTEPQVSTIEPPSKLVVPSTPITIEEKFSTRKKVLATEILLSGDSIELRFYDNAEIDGDSISLFLNERLIFQHIRLTGKAYQVKLAVSELNQVNELIMVAENLGAIPPNTSYMVAIVGDKRYEARLESTEGSSAMVRFVK